MARKTAIRVTNSAEIAEREGIENLGAREVAADARRDVVADAKPSTAELLRRARNRSTDAERAAGLLRRCQDAASLEMRGDGFSPDDRADLAAELMARVCADFPHGLPELDDRTVSLTVLCGRAANYRTAVQSQRARNHERFLLDRAERAASADSVAAEKVREDAETAAIEAPGIAAREARRICLALKLDPTGPSFAPIYQWMRDAPGPQCADECGYSAGSWRIRVSNGGKLIRALHADAADMLAAILPGDATIIDYREADGTRALMRFAHSDLSREADGHGETYTGRKLREKAGEWREGTDAGDRPVRPINADAAREACKVTQRAPDKLAGKRAERARTGGRKMVSNGRSRRAVTLQARSEQQARADALRTIGREHSRTARRERAAAIKSAIPAVRREVA